MAKHITALSSRAADENRVKAGKHTLQIHVVEIVSGIQQLLKYVIITVIWRYGGIRVSDKQTGTCIDFYPGVDTVKDPKRVLWILHSILLQKFRNVCGQP